MYAKIYYLKRINPVSAGQEFNFGALIDFSLIVKAATLMFIHVSGRGSAISSAKEGYQVLFITW